MWTAFHPFGPRAHAAPPPPSRMQQPRYPQHDAAPPHQQQEQEQQQQQQDDAQPIKQSPTATSAQPSAYLTSLGALWLRTDDSGARQAISPPPPPPPPPPFVPETRRHLPNDVRMPDGTTRRLWWIAVATKPHPNLDLLLHDCRMMGMHLCVLGWGDPTMQSKAHGYGRKLLYPHRFVEALVKRGGAHDLVLQTDAYDILVQAPSLVPIVQTYAREAADSPHRGVVLSSGEIAMSPSAHLNPAYERRRPGILSEPYPHLNSGVLLGTSASFLRCYQAVPYDPVRTDDQDWWIKVFLDSDDMHARQPPFPDVRVDTHARLALSLAGTEQNVAWDRHRGAYFDRKSTSVPAILHFDGPDLKRHLPSFRQRLRARHG